MPEQSFFLTDPNFELYLDSLTLEQRSEARAFLDAAGVFRQEYPDMFSDGKWRLEQTKEEDKIRAATLGQRIRSNSQRLSDFDYDMPD